MTIDRNKVIGIRDIDQDKIIPMNDTMISSILSDIKETLQKRPKKKLKKDKIEPNAHLNTPQKFQIHWWTFLKDTLLQSEQTNLLWDCQTVSNIKYT
jgi:hypothetical protein